MMIPRHRIVREPQTQDALGLIVELRGREFDPVFSDDAPAWDTWAWCSRGVALTAVDRRRRIVFADADTAGRAVLDESPSSAGSLALSVAGDLRARLTGRG